MAGNDSFKKSPGEKLKGALDQPVCLFLHTFPIFDGQIDQLSDDQLRALIFRASETDLLKCISLILAWYICPIALIHAIGPSNNLVRLRQNLLSLNGNFNLTMPDPGFEIVRANPSVIKVAGCHWFACASEGSKQCDYPDFVLLRSSEADLGS